MLNININTNPLRPDSQCTPLTLIPKRAILRRKRQLSWPKRAGVPCLRTHEVDIVAAHKNGVIEQIVLGVELDVEADGSRL